MRDKLARPDDNTEPSYAVGVSHIESGLKKVAVFVTHGMGQPIPFQTLDAVAEALRVLDEKQYKKDPKLNPKPKSNTIKSGDVWLQRIELTLREGPAAVEAHVYEGYWAPITEGRITAANVIGFLAGAGANGLKISSGTFKRWLFNSYEPRPTLIRTVLYLLIALATMGALVAMNITIGLVAGGNAFLSQRPAWLTEALLADLTTLFNVVVTSLLVFGLSLAVSSAMRRVGSWREIPMGWAWPWVRTAWGWLLRALGWVRTAWGWVTIFLFAATLLAMIMGGFSIVLLFVGHVRHLARDGAIWPQIFTPAVVDRFNGGFDDGAWFFVLLLGLGVLAKYLFGILAGIERDTGPDASGKWLTILISLAFAAITAAVIWLAFAFLGVFLENGGGVMAAAQHWLAWPMLVVLSAYIRTFLVQYVGDVAIYVMPYKLDAFNDLRKEIKETVYKIAHAVYAQKKEGSATEHEYDQVILVGHSLGSVIAYDVLNRLILEDRATNDAINAVSRTALFLTFGSPLDKTAFIFSIQGHGTSEARESLAASVQPLIEHYKYRPRKWINIYSPWDILGGHLDLYDPLIGADPDKKVRNKVDPDATTLLAAHTEYWQNKLMVRTIYDEIS